MIIRGGQVFILDNDTFHGVSFTDSQVVMDVAENASQDDYSMYIGIRAKGCNFLNCHFIPMQTWAKQKAKESIATVKSDLHLKQAPIITPSKKKSIMQRIRKFLRLGVAS